MTDSQSEVIQWWAEKVEWLAWPRPCEGWDGADRMALGALAGLAEDWLRERCGFELDEISIVQYVENGWYCHIKYNSRSAAESDQVDDPTIAKLLAFRSLAEKLDG